MIYVTTWPGDPWKSDPNAATNLRSDDDNWMFVGADLTVWVSYPRSAPPTLTKEVIERATNTKFIPAADAAPGPTASAPTTTSDEPVASQLGQTWTSPYVKITVTEFNPNVPTNTDAGLVGAGNKWVGIKAKACNRVEDNTFSWAPWSLRDADDGVYPSLDLLGPAFPKPTYPQGDASGVVKTNECVSGWIVFEVPKGAKITQVKYSSDAGTHSWTIK